jgi:IS4 transposase
MRRGNAVPHDHSVFYRLVKQVPWKAFDALVVRLGTDADERGFDSRSHLVAMLYAQLSGAVSLREVAAGQLSHAGRLYHLGAVPARRSTLSDANRDRDSGLFSELFTTLLGQMHPGARRGLREATYLIDATVLPLPAHRAPWAHFSAQACGAKMHVIYDAGAERPIYAAVTPARVNDITAAQAMPIEPGATYVFDLGYYDYAWWAALDAAQCRIVTRLKVNTPLHDVTERPLPADSSVLSDRVGWLPARQARNRKNPMAKPVREVRVLTETGKQLRILSNDLNATAAEIAALYQRRWAIELFFRWVKQTLRIRHFFGCSENAVRIQIATALIAFLLLRLAQASQTAIASPLAFARLVRANLMHRRPIEALTRPPPRKRPWQFPHHQMALL